MRSPYFALVGASVVRTFFQKDPIKTFRQILHCINRQRLASGVDGMENCRSPGVLHVPRDARHSSLRELAAIPPREREGLREQLDVTNLQARTTIR